MRVIMPVWAVDQETIQVTEQAIESFKGHEILIVDNGSTVGGGQLREWADIYIRNKENLGYAKAVNQGLKLSYGPVAIANNDIRVSPNWFEVAAHIMAGDPLVGTIHFRMTPYDMPFKYGTHTWETGRERWCTGSFFVICSISPPGGFHFDGSFLNSYDDWDLQTRVRKGGLHTVYTTKACYQHLDSFTQKKVVTNEDRQERDRINREYFKTKHGEYPEDLYLREFPEQMAKDWRSGFDEL